MRGISWLASALALGAALGVPHRAAADSLDPALARLVADNNCRVAGVGHGVYYSPQAGFARCALDNGAFARLVAQYGAAVAPTAMHSARTTGYGGFELAVEGAFTTIDNGASYWVNGTAGPQDPSTKTFSSSNASPPSVLQLYSLKLRKGFPLGLEVSGNFGYLAQTGIYTVGADLRWSIFEGFRTGIPAFFPEVAVAGGVRTLMGTDQLQLTVASADGQISKPIPIAGTTVFTPYVGYQFLRIFGDSGLIDLTPNTDAINYCGYTGSNTPATPDAGKTTRDGQPVCAHGTSADFNNTGVFNPVRLNRHRIIAGVQLRMQMVRLGGQFMYDLVDPGDANPVKAGETNLFKGVGRQATMAFDIGAVF